MGERLIVPVPHDPQGVWRDTNHFITEYAFHDFNCRWIGMLEDSLGLLGRRKEQYDLLGEARYSFHLLDTHERADVDQLIYEIENRHNDPTGSQRNQYIGFVKYVEREPELFLDSNSGAPVGKRFSFEKTWHLKYRNDLMKIDKSGSNGAGIKIAVVDTGVEPGTPGVASTNFFDVLDRNARAERDDSGHGTMMTRIIHDIAPGAELYVYRAVKEKIAKFWDLMTAIADAVTSIQPHIINLSLGLPHTDCQQCSSSALVRSRACRDFLTTMSALQQKQNQPEPVYVAATGNQGRPNGFNIPARYDFTLAVGALDSSKARADYSNYGASPNTAQKSAYVMAPGGKRDAQDNPVEYIGTATSTDDQGLLVTTYCIGTSPATAMASGLLALCMQNESYGKLGAKWMLDKIQTHYCSNAGITNHTDAEHGKGLFLWK